MRGYRPDVLENRLGFQASMRDFCWLFLLIGLGAYVLFTKPARVVAETAREQSQFMQVQCAAGLTPWIRFADGSLVLCGAGKDKPSAWSDL